MKIRMLALLSIVFFVAACAGTPQMAIDYDQSLMATEPTVIGIAVNEAPEPTIIYPGAGCLLCVGVAAAANSGLSKQVKTFSTVDLTSLGAEIAEALRQQGHKVVMFEGENALSEKDFPKRKAAQDTAKRDYSSLAASHGISQLIMLDFTQIGATRSYSSYVPISDPMAVINGKIVAIDVASSAYRWYLPLNELRSAEGDWKQPPQFPNMTNAYYQLVENVRDSALEPFALRETHADRAE